MTQNATLSAVQEKVIALLASGETVTDAAAAAGCDRSTVHRWLRDDFAFQAELNRVRFELRHKARQRIAGLADAAIKAVEQALKDGNAKLGYALLESLGLLSSFPGIGSQDAKVLEEEAKQAKLFDSIRFSF